MSSFRACVQLTWEKPLVICENAQKINEMTSNDLCYIKGAQRTAARSSRRQFAHGESLYSTK